MIWPSLIWQLGTDGVTIIDGVTVTLSNVYSESQDGEDGEDGQDGINGDGTVTICHKVTHPVDEHPEWGSNTNVTLTYNLSDYIQHIYEYHNGNSSQNDAFGSCDDN